MYTICTAGHVDHGKSTLVRALTDMEPDRLAEERARSLTIDLGFAWTDLDVGGEPATVFFLDLPGHERFITNMLAGAVSSARIALFVVAADEGWMPQSAEHLQILDLLGVSAGVVVLTKADLVDADTLEVARELVREELAGSRLAGVPIVAVSAQASRGLDELRAALAGVLRGVGDMPHSGRPRLWIDRCFSVVGAGTVVTGTLSGGPLREGEEVLVDSPGGPAGRIRGLQVMHRRVEVAQPGMRVAVNLAGVTRGQASRGNVLCRPGEWTPTEAFDAEIRTSEGYEIGQRGAWHIHIGSGHFKPELRPLDVDGATTGHGYARVELDGALTLAPGDRFVLRDVGRRETVGGGRVLDVAPPGRLRGRRARAARAAALDARRAALGAGRDLLALHVEERGHAPRVAAARAVDLLPAAATAAAAEAGLVTVGDAWVHPGRWAAWRAAALEEVRRFHRAEPIERVAKPAVAIRALERAGCPSPLAQAVIDGLVAEGALVAEFAGVRDPDHSSQLEGEAMAAREALLAVLREQGLAPPRITELLEATGASDPLLRELLNREEVVRLDAEYVALPEVVDGAVLALRAAFEDEGPLSVSRAKDVLGITRRHALPLLYHLDRVGRTSREGDLRRVKPAP